MSGRSASGRPGSDTIEQPLLVAGQDVVMSRFEATRSLPASADEAFAWHARPGAFERLQPPWQRLEIVSRSGGIEVGSRLIFRLRQGPFSIRWVAEHDRVIPGRQFRDVQVEGPFASWSHSHSFEPRAEGCLLRDAIEYRLPFGPLGRLVGGRRARRELERLFAYRHATTAADLALHARHRDLRRLRVAVAGASGLIGRQFCALLGTGGHRVLRLVRRAPTGADELRWDPAHGVDMPEALEGIDALVFLAGENVASGRWSARRKTRLWSSRIDAVARLLGSLAELERPPRAFLCASGVSFYGDGADDAREDDASGDGFLAELAARWEQTAQAADYLGSRVALLRFGVVLDPRGGALAKMLPAYRAGLGGIVGDGGQRLSWVSLDDAIAAVYRVLVDPELVGPINVCAPRPVTQKELARTLGRVLRRPLLGRLPAPLARLAFGELADESLLASIGAVPARLEEDGFVFRHPELEPALRHVLGRRPKPRTP